MIVHIINCRWEDSNLATAIDHVQPRVLSGRRGKAEPETVLMRGAKGLRGDEEQWRVPIKVLAC
ncbi:hypothetical protein E2C01_030900 [Portunus trituberculatus]|uniref:Uncharacterized protein n=1 Tax=Portunus trituberculatus TaxID=210409 RepID=A0A5B7ET32_PORTR|nr:hypothetical protein [Portunus trituberculatus]